MKSVLGVFRRKPLMLLFFCLSLSALAASLWFNRLPEEIKEQLGVLGQMWTNQPEYGMKADKEAVYSVFLRRAEQATVIWLAGMTPCSLAVLCAASSAAGFSMAAVLSVLTAETGLFALPLFLLSLFPQWIFYAPVAAVLFRWGLKEEKKVRTAAGLILLSFLAAGAVSEVWLSPRWISWVGTFIFH